MAQTGQETVIVKGSATSFGFITEKNRLINEKKQQLISEGKEIVDIVEQPPSNSLGFKTQEVRIIWRTSNRFVKSKMGQSVAPLKVAVRKQLENVPVSSQNFDAILERVFIFLEDGEWERADFYCEQLLNFNPKSGVVYLGKLMAELKVNTKNGLKNLAEPFEDNANCVKASRFDSALAKKLKADNIFIRERNKAARRQSIYDNALSALSIAKTEAEYKTAALRFETISGFRDADEKVTECLDKAEISRKDEIYDLAAAKMNEDAALNSTAISFQLEAIKLFESIIDWKDSRAKIDECNNNIADIKIAEEKAEAERKRKAEEARIAAEKAKARNKKIAVTGASIAAALIVFLVVLNTVIIPKHRYNRAVEKFGQEKADEFFSLRVGDIYTFGSYEQDNDSSNGKEEIKWRVLAKKKNRILVISEYALDCYKYNTQYTDVTWETCSLRKWLNSTFFLSAFSTDEQKMIQETKVTEDDNPSYFTSFGNDTADKVFLLSITEAEKYFSSDEDRKCVPTAYAIEQSAYTSSNYTKGGKATCWWWLRSPGYYSHNAAYVRRGGGIYYFGGGVHSSTGCMRPALWIEI